MVQVLEPISFCHEPRSIEGPIAVRPLFAGQERCWNEYVERDPASTLFHTLGWRDAVRRSFGHAEHYLMAARADRVVGVLPMFLVSSRIGGRMLVSSPYGVGGGMLADDEEATNELLSYARELATELRCGAVDFRSERAMIDVLPVTERYVGFRRELPDRVEDVPTWFPRKARAAARNAKTKHGLIVSYGEEHLRTVWQLYCINMRRLASIAYPFQFFHELVRSAPETWVSVLSRNDQPVAGLLSFRYRNTIMPYFFGATDEAAKYNAANLAYHALAERAVEEGCTVFDFGRSRRDNSGSYNFKRFNGFEPTPLQYQRLTLNRANAPDLSPSNPRFRWGRRVWPHLPCWFTTFVGGRLAKHIPG